MARGVGRPVEGEFFAARREAHAEVVFDQLEVPVVVTEQDGGIGAFSEFQFTHKRSGVLPPYRGRGGILPNRRWA